MNSGKTPDLAEDGHCANTECAIRGTDQCPIFRMIQDIAVPAVNNIINLPNKRGEHAGFGVGKYEMKQIRDPEITHLGEEKQWRAITEEMLQAERDSFTGIITKILQKRKKEKPTAEIIPFAQQNIA